MGQARLRGTHDDRIQQAHDREQVALREERAQRSLFSIAMGQTFGLGGPYRDDVALAMAAKSHGLEVAMIR